MSSITGQIWWTNISSTSSDLFEFAANEVGQTCGVEQRQRAAPQPR